MEAVPPPWVSTEAVPLWVQLPPTLSTPGAPQDPPLRLVAELKKISSETKVSFTAEGALATPQERNSSTRPRQKEQKLW
jgi:hypothetical protein